MAKGKYMIMGRNTLVGDKIRLIRINRSMTQQELGEALGWSGPTAEVRIGQYERGVRLPKQDLIIKIAEVLQVNQYNFYTVSPGSAEDIMRTLFWIEIFSPGSIRLFQLSRNSGKTNASKDRAVRYNDNDDWPAHTPVGVYFDDLAVNEDLKEWFLRQEEFRTKKISKHEYFEWMFNWPRTCDADKGSDSYIPWREEK